MSSGLRFLDGRRVLAESPDRWAALLDLPGALGLAPSLFLESAFLAAWARHLAPEQPFLLAVLEEEGAWLAGLPLTRSRGRLGRWRLRLAGIAGAPMFDCVEVPAADPGRRRTFLEALLRELPRALPGWTALDLRELPAAGPTLAALRGAAAAAGRPVHERLCARSPLLPLEGPEPPRPSRNLRSQLGRSRRRLAGRGAVELHFSRPTADAAEVILEECAGVEAASWKGARGTGVLRAGPPRDFARELWRTLTPSGRIGLGTLRLDGRLVAYHWGWICGRRWLSYNLAQLPEVDDAGAGTLLMQAMVEQAPELGLDLLDGSRGSLLRPHLLARYRGPVREHVQAVLYHPGLRGRALGLARHRLLPAARSLRRRLPALGRKGGGG